ncbi:hypothetical protein D7I43_25040 [Micromonospora globbae]|uniref:Uncharacterized protein n=1 Tax=Micromonospora globbae TaxID=1894969 RepID=A0A420EWM0_9ACTN|nr:hypothetical protein D7I43_25040 [Micromonospora globbae]
MLPVKIVKNFISAGRAMIDRASMPRPISQSRPLPRIITNEVAYTDTAAGLYRAKAKDQPRVFWNIWLVPRVTVPTAASCSSPARTITEPSRKTIRMVWTTAARMTTMPIRIITNGATAAPGSSSPPSATLIVSFGGLFESLKIASLRSHME